MFNRPTRTCSIQSGQTYLTHRLVRFHCVAGRVRQQNLVKAPAEVLDDALLLLSPLLRAAVETHFPPVIRDLLVGLSRPQTHKGIEKVRERIGRLKEQSRGVAQHYTIEVLTDFVTC